MATGQYATISPQLYSSYDQPGVIVPPNSNTLDIPLSNPVLSNSPCPECALHSTILHSMAFNMKSMDYTACQHLHASASCSSCYSNYQLQRQHSGLTNRNHHIHHHNNNQFHLGTSTCKNSPHQSSTTVFNETCFVQNEPRSSPHESYQTHCDHNHGGWPLPTLPLSSSFISEENSSQSTNYFYPTPTSAPFISLPSPTLAIPSISPFLDSHTKSFEIPPLVENPSYSFAKASMSDASVVEEHQVDLIELGSSSTTSTEYCESQGVDESFTNISRLEIGNGDKNLHNRQSKPRLITSKNTKMPPEKKKPKHLSNRHNSSEIRKRHPEDVCQVCGDKASGYHYNALTCEGCKGFFRRSVTNKTSYKQGCKQGGTCEMDTYTRRKCPHCRLKKCVEVGMLAECLLTEIQCQSKRRRRKAKQEETTDTPKSEENASQSDNNISSPGRCSVTSSPCGSEISRTEEVSISLTDEEQNFVQHISKAFEKYKINPEIVRRWENYINKESNKTCRLSDIATVHVQVLVEYTKNLPGFLELDPEDQIALLKGSVMEAMLIRNSCGYNHLTRKINMRAIIEETGIEAQKIEALIDFFSCIGRLDMDETEYGLLIAIVLFNSDYPYVKNKTLVDQFQDKYLNVLAKYSTMRQPTKQYIFPKILSCLTEVRELSHFHSGLVMSWKKRGSLTPLLCEIWDLD